VSHHARLREEHERGIGGDGDGVTRCAGRSGVIFTQVYMLGVYAPRYMLQFTTPEQLLMEDEGDSRSPVCVPWGLMNVGIDIQIHKMN